MRNIVIGTLSINQTSIGNFAFIPRTLLKITVKIFFIPLNGKDINKTNESPQEQKKKEEPEPLPVEDETIPEFALVFASRSACPEVEDRIDSFELARTAEANHMLRRNPDYVLRKRYYYYGRKVRNRNNTLNVWWIGKTRGIESNDTL